MIEKENIIINSNNIEIWVAAIDEILAGISETDISGLSSYRREKVARLTNENAKNQSIAAGFLLEKALFENTVSKKGYKADVDYSYSISHNGKPSIVMKSMDDDPVFISLSHSKTHAAVAISNVNIGLDIEDFLPKDVWEKRKRIIDSRFFTKKEQDSINNQKDFLKLWTKKEALIKLLDSNIENITKLAVEEEEGSITESLIQNIYQKEYEWGELTLVI